MTTAPVPPGPEELTYLYAVGRAAPELAAAAAASNGLYGSPVRTVTSAGLAAVVTSVPAADFGDAGLKAQLEDLERLETIARSHHAVIDDVAGQVTVLPMRLATVYFDDERVARMLDASHARLDDLLGRLDGHLEWGVKVYADPDSGAPAAAEDAGPPDASGGSPGRAYLQQRRARRSRSRDVFRAAGQAAVLVAEAAARYASDRVAHRPQQGELAQGAGENIANDAYLVPLARAREFRAAVEEAGRGAPGVRVDVTGPWAPYSFAGPGHPVAAEAGHER